MQGHVTMEFFSHRSCSRDSCFIFELGCHLQNGFRNIYVIGPESTVGLFLGLFCLFIAPHELATNLFQSVLIID